MRLAQALAKDFHPSLIFPRDRLDYLPRGFRPVLQGADVKYRFTNHVLDTDRREFLRGSEAVAVEPQVFDLLVHLVDRPPINCLHRCLDWRYENTENAAVL